MLIKQRASFALALAAASATAQPSILIDDFTQTSDPALYPEVAIAAEPPILSLLSSISDPFGLINGTTARRSVQFSSFIDEMGPFIPFTTDPLTNTQTVDLDPAAGELSSVSVGLGNPNFALTYAAVPGDSLDLDLSPLEAVVITYRSNADFTAELVLANTGGGGASDRVAANRVDLAFAAGANTLLVALESVSGLAQEPDLSTFPDVTFTDLPDADFSSIDTLTLSFDNAPEGLEFALSNIAIIPEPGSAALLLLAPTALMARRRRLGL